MHFERRFQWLSIDCAKLLEKVKLDMLIQDIQLLVLAFLYKS